MRLKEEREGRKEPEKKTLGIQEETACLVLLSETIKAGDAPARLPACLRAFSLAYLSTTRMRSCLHLLFGRGCTIWDGNAWWDMVPPSLAGLLQLLLLLQVLFFSFFFF